MMSNCIKITDYGEVSIRVKYEADVESIPSDWEHNPKETFDLNNSYSNFFYQGDSANSWDLPYGSVEISKTHTSTQCNTQTAESFLNSQVTKESLSSP